MVFLDVVPGSVWIFPAMILLGIGIGVAVLAALAVFLIVHFTNKKNKS